MILGSGFADSDLRFRIRGFGFWVGFSVLGFGVEKFPVSGVGLKVWGSEIGVEKFLV